MHIMRTYIIIRCVQLMLYINSRKEDAQKVVKRVVYLEVGVSERVCVYAHLFKFIKCLRRLCREE